MWFSQKCSFFPSWLHLGWSSTVWQLSTTTLTLTTQPIFKQPILIISTLVIQRKSFTLLFLYIKGDNSGLQKKVSLHCDEAGVWIFLELTNEFANLCRNVARLFCIECSFSDDVASQLASNDFKIE